MGRNILVITYWSFSDALVQTYTLPYLRIIRDILPEGSKIFLVTLEKENFSREEKKIENGIYQISFASIPFGLKAMLAWRKNLSFLRKFIRTQNIDTIHSWCSPGGAIGYLLSKKTGVPLIVDSYEPHAEPMVETGTWKKGGIAFRILFRLEKKQTFHAKYLIGVVKGMQDYAKEKYGYSGNNFLFKPACIDLNQFNLSRRKNSVLLKKLNLEGKIVCVYAGKFGGLYLKDEVFEFFHRAFEHWGNDFRVLLLTSTPRNEIEKLCGDAIPSDQVISAFVPHEEMADYLGLGDFAFSAFKPVPSRLYCTPIKNGEYWAMGLPVVIPKGISEDSDIISKSKTGVVLENFSETELKTASDKIDILLDQNVDGKLSEKIHELAAKHRNFKIAENVYRKIYGK